MRGTHHVWRTREKTRPVWHSGEHGKSSLPLRATVFQKVWDTILLINTWQLCVRHVGDDSCTCPQVAVESGSGKELDEELNQQHLKALKYSRAFLNTAESHSSELSGTNTVFCVPGAVANTNAAFISQAETVQVALRMTLRWAQVGTGRGSEVQAASPPLSLSCQGGLFCLWEGCQEGFWAVLWTK